MEPDIIVLVPGERVDEDVLRVMAPGEHAREQDPVIVTVGLVTEHDDVEAVAAAAPEELLHEARPGHSVADDDEPLLLARAVVNHG